MEAYLIHIATLFGIFLIASFSYNLLTGWAGLLTLGQAGMMGVGGYASALILLRTDLPFPAAILAAVVASAGVAALLALLSRQIRSHTYSVLTLWFGFVLVAIFTNWRELTRGALGLPGIPRPEGFSDHFVYLLLVLLIALLVYLFVDRITKSPWGRALGAMRDDELAAVTLGKNLSRMKVTVSAIAGGIAGLSGALLASFLRFIDPQSFGLTLLVVLLVFLIAGGLASLPGSIAGVALLLAMREAFRFLDLSPELVGAIREILFAGVLLLVVMLRPRGIAGRVELE